MKTLWNLDRLLLAEQNRSMAENDHLAKLKQAFFDDYYRVLRVVAKLKLIKWGSRQIGPGKKEHRTRVLEQYCSVLFCRTQNRTELEKITVLSSLNRTKKCDL